MGALKVYADLNTKKLAFRDPAHFIIRSPKEFDDWYDMYMNLKTSNRTNYIFRGMKEAKHRMYTSSQRRWIENEMHRWPGLTYAKYISNLAKKAGEHPLLAKVFDIYSYSQINNEIPLLSIMQHYGATTPLMDWTYNFYVALFFATENVTSGNGNSGALIDEFFSIYVICKENKEVTDHLINIRTLKNQEWDSIFQKTDDEQTDKKIYYISDFEDPEAKETPNDRIVLRTNKPLTSIFNQNIIPQEGLFLLNTTENDPFDDILSRTLNQDRNLQPPFQSFSCFNISKDLADYVRRKIKQRGDIDQAFIYPDLRKDIPGILNDTLNSLL
jgi:hypothetical protein